MEDLNPPIHHGLLTREPAYVRWHAGWASSGSASWHTACRTSLPRRPILQSRCTKPSWGATGTPTSRSQRLPQARGP